MTFLEMRNQLVAGLWEYLGRPVVLSNQVQPEPDYPFGIYTVTAPFIPDKATGEYINRASDEDGIVEIDHMTMPTATFSFTFCGINRDAEDGTAVSGEDEAWELANKAIGYFQHCGYDNFLKMGITIVEVGQVQDRTQLIIDEAARRFGFDVLVRYTRTDTRKVSRLDYYKIHKKE